MSNVPVRWLLDVGLPRLHHPAIDAVHADDFERIPGHCGLREATAMDRTLVTCDQEFRGSWNLPLEHPGIVILEHGPLGPEEMERNLLHLEFRIGQYHGWVPVAGNRFVVRPDREVLHVLPDGDEVDLAPWRLVHFGPSLVLATSVPSR